MGLLTFLGRTPQPVVSGMLNTALWAGGGLICLILLAGCSAGESPTDAPTDAPSGERAERDPYQVYLENNPKPELVLSREDAQTRAYAGCGMKFAPGTVDAVLRDAYKPDCPRD